MWKCSIPKDGTIKTINKFAWLPVLMSDGYKVWLQSYKELKAYVPQRHTVEIDGLPTIFKNSNWVTLSKAINE